MTETELDSAEATARGEEFAITPVEDNEVIYRRVLPGRQHYHRSNGKIRVSAAAFSDPENEPSVDRANICRELVVGNSEPAIWTQQAPENSVVALMVSRIRSIKKVDQCDTKGNPLIKHAIDVEHDPMYEERVNRFNRAHSVISAAPEIQKNNVFRKLREALAGLVDSDENWAIKPTDV